MQTTDKTKKRDIRSHAMLAAFCAVTWLLLAFYECDLLRRVEAQSLFLDSSLFFDTSMKVPAGLLSWLGCFLTQFLYYPALGATLFVALLAAVYFLAIKAFRIPASWSVVALAPLFMLLAINTQMGYWIFYLKQPGWWFVPTLGTIVSLLAVWGFNRVGYKWHIPFIIIWTVAGYPLFGFYATFSAVLMSVIALSSAVRNGNRMRIMFDGVAVLLVALLLAWEAPVFWYGYYSSVAKEFIHTAALPTYHWDVNATHFVQSIWQYWLPYILLFALQLLLAAFAGVLPASGKTNRRYAAVQAVVLVLLAIFVWDKWYCNENFRIENKQDTAMWRGDWRAAADYARDTELPSRQIVMNRNIALLNLGCAGDEMFTYPDGSADIDAPMAVHLTHTGGLMTYWCYGKFNFCYRWCMENAVEQGWRVEYLKHAVRSLLLNGEYTLAKRYTGILKHTLFHKSWAERYEKYIDNPALIEKAAEFKMPLAMCVYNDALDVDESFVEAYLMNNISNTVTTEHSPLFNEAALMATLTRKDAKLFWPNLQRYLHQRKVMRLPTHYQEAILLFSALNRNIDIRRIPIDDILRQRFSAFMRKTRDYKGKKEAEMAPHFKKDFGNTYWYFYFFVRDLKTN